MAANNVLVFLTNCPDASREEEFNNWYNNVHFKDILKLPGFKGATRYRIAAPPEAPHAKYLAVYEIEGDIGKAMAELDKARPQWAAAGRMFDGTQVFYAAPYQAITEFIKAE